MNSYGKNFRINIFGESHGPAVGVVMDGVPAGLPLCTEDFLPDINRRRSGAKGTTARRESDLPVILSGVCDGRTTGAPLAVTFGNGDVRSADYSKFRDIPRPGHADFTAGIKYGGCNDLRGGGHFSGRLTLPLVAAGTVARKIIGKKNILVQARMVELAGIPSPEADGMESRSSLGNRFPQVWQDALDDAMAEGDSVGGVIECCCRNVPAGLGSPFFDSMESRIAHLVFSIPGVRGISFGEGFEAAARRGSEHNDAFIDAEGHTATNHAGGINGGITNGNPVTFRVAIKPTSSISLEQSTFNFRKGEMDVLSIPGRHDTCIALRCPVIVEAAAAIVLADELHF